MRLSTRGRYAVMAMVELAARQEAVCAAAKPGKASVPGRFPWRISRKPNNSRWLISNSCSAICAARGSLRRRAAPAAAIAWPAWRTPFPSPPSSMPSTSPLRATRCEEGSPGCLAGNRCLDPRPLVRAGRADPAVPGQCDPGGCGGRQCPRPCRHPQRRLPAGRQTPPNDAALPGCQCDRAAAAGSPGRGAGGPRCRRQPLLGPWPRPGRPAPCWRTRAKRWPRSFGMRRGEVVFTSGGTEANALAIHGLGQGRRILVGATEHPAVLAAAGPGAEVIPVRPDGTLDLDALASDAAGPAGPGLPDGRQQRDRRAAPAGRGRCPLPGRMAPCCMSMRSRRPAGCPLPRERRFSLAISGHKLGGPPGAGALLLRPGLDPAGADRRRRPGTRPPRRHRAAARHRRPRRRRRGRRRTRARLAALRDRIEAGARRARWPAPARRAWPIPPACCCPACRPRPR